MVIASEPRATTARASASPKESPRTTEAATKSSHIRIDRVSIHDPRIQDDYSSMWEYDPGEERDPKEASILFTKFVNERDNPIAVAALRTNESGNEHWLGSAFGYEKRPDQLIHPEKQGAIASVFVSPNARLQGAASQMVSHLLSYFEKDLHLKGVQLYASPDGRKVYVKNGFIDGDEMRYKLAPLPNDSRLRLAKISLNKTRRLWSRFSSNESLIHPMNKERIRIRQAKSDADTAFIVDNEMRAHGLTSADISTEQRETFMSPLRKKADDRAMFIAYQLDGKGNEKLLGSAPAELWRYPVPDTFRSEGPLARRDLFGNLRLADGVTGRLVKSTYLRLALQLIDHAETHNFTQINIHQAGEARAALAQLGFKNGIHMLQQFEPQQIM